MTAAVRTGPDVVLFGRDTILADADVSVALAGRVYGNAIPKNANTLPLALITCPGLVPNTKPLTQWWKGLLVIDVHAASVAQARQLGVSIAALFADINGVSRAGVIASTDVNGIQLIEDDEWTPPRYRSLVTVDVTARGPKE